MTSRPVRRLPALLGMAATAAVLAGVVAMSSWLVPAGTVTPPLEAPAEDHAAVPGVVVCPADLPVRDAPLPVVSSDLFDCPRLYDGVRVRYTGEVIQAVLRRGDRAWVQLNDDIYALDVGPIAGHRTALGGNSGVAVSIPRDIADDVARVGDGSGRGDVIELTGTFHRADPDDGGGPTIQADAARISDRGTAVTVEVLPRRVAVAGVLAATTLLLLLGVLRARRQR
jgi:hypothetical protein